MNRRAQLAALIRKELEQTLRDRRIMFLIIAVPLVQVIVFGFAVDFEVDRIPTLVVDRDDSVESRAWTRRLYADETLIRAPRIDAARTAEDAYRRALVEDRADVVVIFPPGFSRDLSRRQRPRVQVLLDGSDPNRTTVAQSFVSGLFQPASDRVRMRMLFNPGLDTPPFMLPGVAGILLLLVTTIVAAMGLARERETGTLEQLRVTPIPPAILLSGKVLPFALVGLLDFGLAMSVAHFGFDMPLRGSLVELLSVALLFIACTLGTGLAISTYSRNQQQAFLLGFVFLLPTALLSGVFTPIASMPEWLQLVTWANPMRHYTELVRVNVFTGRSLAEAPIQVAALLIYALAVSALAVARFSRVKD